MDARLEDDGGPEVIAIERDGDQALWVRVGPVFDERGQEDRPGIWIAYQEHYMASDLQGPVLLTEKVWDLLVDAVANLRKE
jgi:hypothetical protein